NGRFREVRDGGMLHQTVLYRALRADGGVRWIDGTVSDLRGDPSVGGIVVNGRDVTERVEAEERLAHLARHDPLTGLPNRAALLAIDDRHHVVTASIGIAITKPGDREAVDLLRQADLAMYRAKELGKGRYEVFDQGLARRARRRLDVEAELRVAMRDGQLELHYQPEVDMSVDRLIGMEALVRWRHPVRGLLLPHDFIDVAEESE